MSVGFECWDHEVWGPEAATARERFSSLIGSDEQEVLAALGSPDRRTPRGLERRADSGTILWQSDEDLWYYSIIPHATMSFSMSKGRVASIWFAGKFRQCPPELRGELGARFSET